MSDENKYTEEEIEEEKDRSGIMFTSDAETGINSSALGSEASPDEVSLSQALSQNSFKLFVTRFLIKLKNHIAIIPMIFVVITLMILTFNIQTHVNAQQFLSHDTLNSFWFFINVLLSLVSALLYIMVQSKKTPKKKWIVMFVLFFVVIGCSILIDVLYLRDINIELSLTNHSNSISEDKFDQIYSSYNLTLVHVIFLIVDAVLAGLVPLLQPITKKIQVGFNNKKKAE